MWKDDLPSYTLEYILLYIFFYKILIFLDELAEVYFQTT